MRWMNKPLVIGALALLLAQAAPAQAPLANSQADCLFLRSGDTLYGKLLAVEPRDVVRWQHPDASDPIEFNAAGVSQVDFPVQKGLATQSDFPCRIVLANGDVLSGNWVSCDRETATFDTWYAGKLRIPRTAILSVAFNSRAPAVFDGITGLEGWTQGASSKAFVNGAAGQWVYRHGGLYADKPASIARDLKLPPMANIEFDLAWKGMLIFSIGLYTDSLQPILLTEKENGPDFGGFYSLRLGSPARGPSSCRPSARRTRCAR